MHKYYLLLFSLLISCSRYPQDVENALRQAGDNRGELEKVLKHYSRDPADSLKLRAAEFLIVNMPGKYSDEYVPFENFEAAFDRWNKVSKKQSIIKAYQLDLVQNKQDIQYITAEYLINNIELAFRVWKTQPWGKHISFDTFCEEILPYRFGTEPLDNWREKILADFSDLNRFFADNPGIDVVQACRMINSELSRTWDSGPFPLPPMNYTMLKATSRGSCVERASLGIFVMRALGVPVTMDFTPQWPNRNVGHSWNAVCDSTGSHISFMATEANPGDTHQAHLVMSKAYRYTFQKPVDEIPMLQEMYVSDVSSEYFDGADIVIKLQKPPQNGTRNAYLASIANRIWTPVCEGTVEEQTMKFKSIGKGVIYLPVYKQDEAAVPSGYPFLLTCEGKIHYWKPDTQRHNIAVSRKYPIVGQQLMHRMKGGRFEAANRPDFSDARLLHVVNDIPEPCFQEVAVNTQMAFRYVRYIAPEQSYGNVAEIEFFEEDEQLTGKLIGTTGSWHNEPSMTADKAFDGLAHTFFNAEEVDGAWVGLDLENLHKITGIRYLPRNDGNAIISGHTYELFYWDGQWVTLGKQTAAGSTLKYDAPINALLWLTDCSHFGLEHVFIYEHGKQIWSVEKYVPSCSLP